MLRCLAALLVIVPTILAASIDKSELAARVDDFNTWKAKFDKFYGSEEEETQRFNIWLNNFNEVARHNEEYKLGLHSYSKAVNVFADMAETELNSMGCSSLPGRFDASRVVQHSPESIPSSLNYTAEGYVTPVKAQLNCGSCWAFGSTGGLEGQYFKKTKTLVSFSEQQLVNCADTLWPGCKEGNTFEAYTYWERKGAESEKDYPYSAKQGSKECKDEDYPVITKITTWKQVARNEEALFNATVNIGPIVVSISTPTSFMSYRTGVYDDSSCSSSGVDHCVLVVGYGTYRGLDYWLVKNSWGESWGLDGYIMMARHIDICNIASDATYPII